MQAAFRFRGAEEIVVRTDAGGVVLSAYEGYESPESLSLKPVASLAFSKSQARAIASALMGAASEL